MTRTGQEPKNHEAQGRARSAPVATGLARGARAEPRLAAQAVERALERAGLTRANSVLLFLSPHFAPSPETALRAAARAAGCLQVTGCTGAGVLTDDGFTVRAMCAHVRVMGETVGIENLSPHDCRHFWATRAARKTPVTFVISEIAFHHYPPGAVLNLFCDNRSPR